MPSVVLVFKLYLWTVDYLLNICAALRCTDSGGSGLLQLIDHAFFEFQTMTFFSLTASGDCLVLRYVDSLLLHSFARRQFRICTMFRTCKCGRY